MWPQKGEKWIRAKALLEEKPCFCFRQQKMSAAGITDFTMRDLLEPSKHHSSFPSHQCDITSCDIRT